MQVSIRGLFYRLDAVFATQIQRIITDEQLNHWPLAAEYIPGHGANSLPDDAFAIGLRCQHLHDVRTYIARVKIGVNEAVGWARF